MKVKVPASRSVVIVAPVSWSTPASLTGSREAERTLSSGRTVTGWPT